MQPGHCTAPYVCGKAKAAPRALNVHWYKKSSTAGLEMPDDTAGQLCQEPEHAAHRSMSSPVVDGVAMGVGSTDVHARVAECRNSSPERTSAVSPQVL